MSKWTDYLEGSRSKQVIKLDELGLDFSVTVKNMSVFTPVQIHEMIVIANNEATERLKVKGEAYTKRLEELTLRVEDEEDDYDEDQMYLELDDLTFSEPTGLTIVHYLLILEWDITDPATDEVLDIPSKNPDVLFKIPVGVQTYLKKKLDEYIEDPESVVPKESATS